METKAKIMNLISDFRMQLQVTVAIDMTKSNGDPQNPKSLHFLHTREGNPYEKAIEAVVAILEDYDS